MSIDLKVLLVEKLFDPLENEITNLHCNTGFGQCCSKPNIEVSPWEFLSWAFYLFFKWQSPTDFSLAQLKNQYKLPLISPSFCFDSHNGSYSNYRYRGLICRLFWVCRE